MVSQTVRARNDIRQYDDLATTWWDSNGPFAMLHWLAEARAALVPDMAHGFYDQPILLDVGCGGGLLAPHVEAKGYRHIGIDLVESALLQARQHNVVPVRADATQLPIANASVDVVCAGEILEHVKDVPSVVAETCRVLRPGGLVILDTIARTRLARLLAVEVAERIHGGAPKGIHDPALFVDRDALIREYANCGVELRLTGLRPSLRSVVAWKRGVRTSAALVPTRFTSVLFQGIGTKTG